MRIISLFQCVPPDRDVISWAGPELLRASPWPAFGINGRPSHLRMQSISLARASNTHQATGDIHIGSEETHCSQVCPYVALCLIWTGARSMDLHLGNQGA